MKGIHICAELCDEQSSTHCMHFKSHDQRIDVRVPMRLHFACATQLHDNTAYDTSVSLAAALLQQKQLNSIYVEGNYFTLHAFYIANNSIELQETIEHFWMLCKADNLRAPVAMPSTECTEDSIERFIERVSKTTAPQEVCRVSSCRDINSSLV